MLRGAPKRNAEGTPLRVLSKHGSDLVLVRDEEAAGFGFCHPDHSSRSLTCGNAVSCALCSIPQRSPQRPRGKEWNAGAAATGRRTPAAQHDEADHAAQQGPFWALCSSVNNEVVFQGGTSASQESLTIRSRKLARLRTVAERPLGADPVDPSALNSHERSCFSTVRRPSC